MLTNLISPSPSVLLQNFLTLAGFFCAIRERTRPLPSHFHRIISVNKDLSYGQKHFFGGVWFGRRGGGGRGGGRRIPGGLERPSLPIG